MRISLLLLLCFGIWIAPVKSQTANDEEAMAPILSRLDSMMKQYRYGQTSSSIYDTLLYNKRNFRSNDIPSYTATQVSQRMADIPSMIPLTYNVYVQRYIDVYTVKKREQTSRMLGLQHVYFPHFEAELDKAGLPMELKYLPIVESALNPHARSRVGATGLWQFMYYTAKDYGLSVNSFVDERKDPLKATQAAVRYMQDSYAEFGDWLLAIAAYNCGPGNVRKAIYRSGGKRDFWSIRDYLPRETRGYVPAFIAVMYVFNYAAEHNIYPQYVEFDLTQDTLHLRRMDITLQEISRMTQSNLDELYNLNPELKQGRVPYAAEPYVLRVPRKTAEYFALNERDIRTKYGMKRNAVLASNYQPTGLNGAAIASRNKTYTPKVYKPKPGTALVYYTVREGDVVGSIAEKYNVSARSIASWNNLRRYRIKVGQKLKIYASKSVAQQKARPQSSGVSASNQPRPTTTNTTGAVYYRVKRGDTLWGIAKKYTRGSVDAIITLNQGMSRSDRLSIGQRIRVK